MSTVSPVESNGEQRDQFPLLDLFDGTESSSSRLVLSVLRTGALLERVVAKSLSPFGLHHAQLNALLLLRKRGQGGLRPSTLGDHLCVSRPNVTKLLARLKSRSLVEERPDPQDGRAVLAVVTVEGAQLAEQAAAVLSQELTQVVGMLPSRDSEVLHDLLERFRDRLAGILVVAGSPSGAEVGPCDGQSDGG